MKSINTLSYDVFFPELFSNDRIFLGTILLINPDEDIEFQEPQVNLTIDKISNIKALEGIDIAEDASHEAFSHAYFKIKRHNLIETSNVTTEVDNKVCYLQKAVSDFKMEDRSLKSFHLMATVIIDETFFLDFTADCELGAREKYESIFLQLLENIKLKGNYSQHYDELEKELEEYEQKITKLTKTSKKPIVEALEIPDFEIPADEKDVFEIGDYSFELKADESNFQISELSHSFYVTIHHTPEKNENLQQATEEKLLSDYYEHIGFDFDLKNVFENYIPTGSYYYEEGKTGAPLHSHLYCRGFEYSLDFFGRVDLKNGWLGINGHLKPPYADEPVFPVKVYSKIDVEKLNWKNYIFRYEEALQAQVNDVRYLLVEKPSFTEIPQDILAFTQLRDLMILGNYDYMDPEKSYSPLELIPESISDLTSLKSFSITNTCLTELPKEMGKLKELSHLNLMNNKLTHLPKSLFELANLKNLYLDNNALENLPNEIHLPNLKSISLSRNKLSTLPVALAQQINLNKISIEQNCLTSLPEEFNAIADIKLDLADKQRLLDFDYQGADGKGAEGFDESLYLVKNDPILLQQFQTAITHTVLEKHQQAFENIALKAICLQTTEEDDYSEIGVTRFGGKPDLPADMPYPEFECSYRSGSQGMQFIAQINCAELSEFQDYLPRSGMLYFFLEDQEGFVCKVIFSESEELQSAQNLDFDEDYIADDGGIFTPYKAAPNNMIAIPDFYNAGPLLAGTSLEDFENSKDIDEYYQQQEELDKKLGVKGIYQSWNDCYYSSNHHAINTYVFTQHESPQEQAALHKKGKMEDWIILLKVYSDNNCGFCFWDAGEISFVIHKSDLAKCDFSNVMCTLETS